MALTVLQNVLTMIVFLLFGFILVKAGKAKVEHTKTLSAILLYILGPAMIISSFLNMEYSRAALLDLGLFFLASLAAQVGFFLILFLIFRKKYADAKYRILTAASFFGNVGYFGLPLLTALFPDDPIAACYSVVYVTTMNLLVFTLGSYLITGDKKHISIKSAILNPTTLSVLVALPLFIFKVDFPDFVDVPLNLLGKMVSPICMIMIGIRLAGANFASLFKRPLVYLCCLFKQVVFPLLTYLCVVFIPGLSDIFKIAMLVLSACPTAVVISSLAELYGKSEELAANSVLFSMISSALTLPLILLIV